MTRQTLKQTEIGEPAPSIELNDEEGRLVRLADFIGRPVLLSFLSHAA